MSAPILILRRPHVPRKRGEAQREDYDVFDGDLAIGRIYLVHSAARADTWFWGVSFHVTRRKSFGYASSREEACAAFRAEYTAFKSRAG
jgi:hypothetical protein